MPSIEFRTDEEMLRIVHEKAEHLHRRRLVRARRFVGAASAIAVIATGLVIARWPESSPTVKTVEVGSDATSTTFTREPLTEPEGWREMSSSPPSGRSQPITIWTGKEMLVWRGAAALSDACELRDGVRKCGESIRDDGAAYDPATDQWRSIPRGPMPRESGSSASQVGGAWTGRELVVWGGARPHGAAYNPATNTWRSIAESPLGRRDGFSMTWTGREVIAVGGVADDGFDSASVLRDGAAYDPVDDEWRKLPPAPSARSGHSAIWVNHELLIIGGVHRVSGPVPAVESYDPSTNSWRSRAQSPLPVADSFAWTGSVIVAIGPLVDISHGGARTMAAAAYDPATDRWQTLAPPPAPAQNLVLPEVVWTGREVVVLGAPFARSTPANNQIPTGAAFDVATKTWRALPSSSLSPRSGSAVAWTGAELLVWGGATYTGFTSEPFADGARYSPGVGR